MVNATAVIEHTGPFTQYTMQNFFSLLEAPINNPEMWWIISPLLFTFLVMTLYFGVYRVEDMGWNTALGNSIVLLFVIIDQIRFIFHYTDPGSIENLYANPIKMIIMACLVFEVLLLFVITTTHAIPKKLAFFIASPTSINLQAYVLITIVYTRIEPTIYLLSAAILLYTLLLISTLVIHLLQYLGLRSDFKAELKEAKQIRKNAKALKKKAGLEKPRKAQKLLQESEELFEKAKKIEGKVMDSQREKLGKIILLNKEEE